MGELKDGDSMILGRADLVAAFDFWVADYLLEPETVEQVLKRLRMVSADLGGLMADRLIHYLIESAEEPIP